MATITSTEIKVYEGATTSGTQVGSTITVQGSPSSVNLDISTLSDNLVPGSQYCVVARCTNSDSYTTAWTTPYPFKTLILAEIMNCQGGDGKIFVELSLTTDSVQESSYGVYVSTNASGANATKITLPSFSEYITTLQENTDYYLVPWVIDEYNREYVGSWSEAAFCGTGYVAPAVTLTNMAATTDTISGTVTVTSNNTIDHVQLTIRATGSQTIYSFDLNATTGPQTFSVSNGDTDDNGVTVVINSSTEYYVEVWAEDTDAQSTNAYTTITTAQQQSTISITSITSVTPYSAVVNLSYA